MPNKTKKRRSKLEGVVDAINENRWVQLSNSILGVTGLGGLIFTAYHWTSENAPKANLKDTFNVKSNGVSHSSGIYGVVAQEQTFHAYNVILILSIVFLVLAILFWMVFSYLYRQNIRNILLSIKANGPIYQSLADGVNIQDEIRNSLTAKQYELAKSNGWIDENHGILI